MSVPHTVCRYHKQNTTEKLLLEYKRLKSLLEEMESLMVATISKVAQWESGSDECYSQLMKTISETIGTDHRRSLHQRDDTAPDARSVIHALEKVVRENMFDNERTSHGIAFLSQLRDEREEGPNQKDVERLLLATEKSSLGVERPVMGLKELKTVGLAQKWVTASDGGHFGFRRISPPPPIDADAKKKLTPREYAVYLMLYREKMRDELPRVAQIYDRTLSKYKEASKRAFKKERNQAAKAQKAILSACMACKPSKETIGQVQDHLAQIAAVKTSHDDNESAGFCDDDDGEGS